jgi:hypothetical protein
VRERERERERERKDQVWWHIPEIPATWKRGRRIVVATTGKVSMRACLKNKLKAKRLGLAIALNGMERRLQGGEIGRGHLTNV